MGARLVKGCLPAVLSLRTNPQPLLCLIEVRPLCIFRASSLSLASGSDPDTLKASSFTGRYHRPLPNGIAERLYKQVDTIDHRPQKRYSLLIIHYSLFPMSLQFSARFYNPGHRLKSISGRFGSFIFRTHTSGLITAFYKPKKSTNVESLSVHSRSVFESLSVQLREISDMLGLFESLSVQLREISDMLGLKITSITTNLPTYETHNP